MVTRIHIALVGIIVSLLLSAGLMQQAYSLKEARSELARTQGSLEASQAAVASLNESIKERDDALQKSSQRLRAATKSAVPVLKAHREWADVPVPDDVAAWVCGVTPCDDDPGGVPSGLPAPEPPAPKDKR